MQRRILSHADEASLNVGNGTDSGKADIDVRREDQDRINRFSRLHQRAARLEAEVAEKRKEKEDIDDVSTELELLDVEEDDDLEDRGADDDDVDEASTGSKVPYKIGDTFVWLSVGDAQDLLATEGEKVSAELAKREGTLDGVKEEMGQLKATLYARFGRSINLEA